MNTYYDEILQELQDLMEKRRYREAMLIVDRELNVPYVPQEFEEVLRKIRRDLSYRLSEDRDEKEDSLNTLLNKLKGKPQTQLAAAEKLCSRNLRDCIEEIRDWLSKDPQPEASALIIEALAKQEIAEEFVLVRNGMEYTFWADDVTPCAESAGFLEALDYLQKYLGISHPDMYQMARSMLIHEVYMFLPLSYEEGEGQILALSVVQKISEMMDEGAVYQEVISQNYA